MPVLPGLVVDPMHASRMQLRAIHPASASVSSANASDKAAQSAASSLQAMDCDDGENDELMTGPGKSKRRGAGKRSLEEILDIASLAQIARSVLTLSRSQPSDGSGNMDEISNAAPEDTDWEPCSSLDTPAIPIDGPRLLLIVHSLDAPALRSSSI